MMRGCGHLQRVPESEREGRTSSCLKHKQVLENDSGSGVGGGISVQVSSGN